MLLAVANRPIDTNTTFTTGGDVSRFQRRTVPAKPMQMAALGAAPVQPARVLRSPANGGVRVVRGNDDLFDGSSLK